MNWSCLCHLSVLESGATIFSETSQRTPAALAPMGRTSSPPAPPTLVNLWLIINIMVNHGESMDNILPLVASKLLTIWLWHSQFANWKITMLLMGKPSISIRAIYTMAMLNASNWLVVDLPLWKMMEFVKWDDDIPNWMESHKSHVNQTTNQQNYLLVSWSSLQPVGTCLAGNDWQIFRDLTGKMAASYPQNLHQKWPKTMHCSPCMNSFDWQTSKKELRGTCST